MDQGKVGWYLGLDSTVVTCTIMYIICCQQEWPDTQYCTTPPDYREKNNWSSVADYKVASFFSLWILSFMGTEVSTVEPLNKGHVGDNINSAVLSFIERFYMY